MILDKNETVAQPLIREGTSLPREILSSKPLDEWLGSLTTFKGFTGTRPENELPNASWDDVVQLICPDQPSQLTDKKRGKYFIPCQLKVAPLVGNTLKLAESQGAATSGKMRSKDHVTEAAMLVMDIDGLPEADFLAGLDRIKNDGLTYLAFSTFSYGNPVKPGMRARLVIPLDRALATEEYNAAWHKFDNQYWGGQAGKADASGAKLYQQQGIWCCDPTRRDKAFKRSNEAGVASADALIAMGDDVKSSPSSVQEPTDTTDYPPSDPNKVADACRQIGLFRAHQGKDQPEPLWRDCLGVVGYCENGGELCQQWSSGYSGYSQRATAQKLATRMKTPPTTCDQFRKTNHEGCQDCKQICRSPITLGCTKVPPLPVIADTDSAVIARLAKLTTVDYDRARKQDATALGIKVSTLDAKVKAARNETELAGRPLFAEVTPYPSSISPAEVLDEIVLTLLRYIIMTPEQADAVALWVAQTWFVDEVNVLAILLINAPEKSCGKSQLLDLVGRLSARPLPASNTSTAALFRTCELLKPTLLIDEADTFIRENNELKGLINAGHTRSNAYVLRVVGDNHEPKRFTVWCAKAFAGITLERHFPDATMSRAIIINLRRKLPSEKVVRIRHAEQDHFETIQAKLARFAEDYAQQVQQAHPVLPEELSDRAQDNWESLLAIAECAGPEWVERAKAASLLLSRENDASVSIGNELLADIQQVFERAKVDKISSADLIESLTSDEEAPWATYNRGSHITTRQLAKLLINYGIKSKTVRYRHGTPKGYDLGQFEDAFKRYLT